jgi:hypothetical protein
VYFYLVAMFSRDRPARPIELLNHGSFPGAACCQIAELPPYPAAAGRLPSRRWAASAGSVSANLSVLIPHPSGARALLNDFVVPAKYLLVSKG